MYLDYFSYFLYLIITIFSIYLIIEKKDFIKKHRSIILFLFIGILIYSQYIRFFDQLFTVNVSYDLKDIPMNYCRISAILIIVYAFTKNKILGQFLYFQAGLGFFSILFPGGDFFLLTQDHRTLGYIFDHFMIANMTVFLIYIDGIKPTKKVMYGAMIYSFIIPFALLPYALNSGHNVFYILDGVFIPLVFGNNQVIISIVYVIGINLYYYLMYLLSKRMIKHSQKDKNNPILKPLWPWVIVGSYLFIGLFVGSFFIQHVPDQIENIADTFESKPVKQLDEFAYVYRGTINDDTVYFIELVEKYEEVEVMSIDGTYLPILEIDGLYYYYKDDTVDTVIILLYKNRNLENEKLATYDMNN